MPRNMSFALTTDQVRNKSKTVTRRFGWWFLKPGDELWAVEKAMGLKKGERVNRLAKIRVISTKCEMLGQITQDDCRKEGFPDLDPPGFVVMLQAHYGGSITRDSECNRIEFEYI